MMMKRIKSIIKGQVGLTLIELMIALAITGIITSTATMITFQVFDGEARANNHMDAISLVQNAGREISRDAGMAQAAVWTEEDFPLTLTWANWEDDTTHQVVYSIEANELKRDHYIDGGLSDSYIFEHVNCERIPNDDPEDTKLNFKLTATVGVGSQQIIEQRVYSITPRPSI